MAASDLKLLAYAPNLIEACREYCAQREGKFPYFRQGYIDLSLGRHTNWTDAIREATTGYGIADGNGNVLATRTTLQAAISAIEKAARPVIPQFELEDEAPTPDAA